MPLVGAVDLGTTSTRFLVFDAQGAVRATAAEELPQVRRQPGWAEQDPEQVYDATCRCVAAALAQANLSPADLSAVGITNQRETTIVWSKSTGRPFYNAVLWHDTRTEEIVDAMGDQDRFRAQTGLPVATYFSGPKLAWLFRNVDGLSAAAEAGDVLFGTFDSWLVYKLTGGAQHVTDVTNASRTLMMDLRSLSWDPALLRAQGIPEALGLPRIVPSSGRIADCAADSPLPGVPIAGVLGDQQAALFGQTCFSPGEAKSTYGTGCFLLWNTGEEAVPSQSGLITTVAYQLEGSAPVYALEGSVAVGGQLVQWLRDSLQVIDSAPQVEERARSVPDNGGVVIVPAFAGLFAPYWRNDARGVICGLTNSASRDHLCRAALEAVAFQIKEVAGAMEKDSGLPLAALKVDGGMVGNELLMQFQADLLGSDVVRPVVAETTALGAAYAAGLAVGVWAGLDDLRANWLEKRRWSSAMAPPQRLALTQTWEKAVERSLNWTHTHSPPPSPACSVSLAAGVGIAGALALAFWAGRASRR